MAHSPPHPLPLLLERLPIFPLPEAHLFPRALLPLHVFEPRYRALVRDALASPDKLVAVPLLAPGFEQEYEGRPAVRPVCGVGEIIQHEAYPDGRYDILLRGLGRVRITDELPPHQTYRLVRAQVLHDRPPPAGSASLADAVSSLVALCERLASALPEGGDTLRSLVRQEPDASHAVDVIAAALVTETEDRQALLEELDVAARLDRVTDLVAAVVDKFTPTRRGGAGPN